MKGKLTLIFAFLLFGIFAKVSWSFEKVYTIGLPPYHFSPFETYERWGSFVSELKKRTGLNFDIRLYKDIKNFEKSYLRGEVDFVFFPPYHQVMAYKAQKYTPLVKEKTLTVGMLVVRKDSEIRDVKDLDGKKIAFPDPKAFGASLYIRAILTKQFKIKFTPAYVGTHDNVCRHVLLGKAHAGGVINYTFLRQPEEIKRELRVLYETPPLAPHAFSAHPRVTKEVRERVKQAILDMAKDERLKPILDRIEMPNPVSADYERDYKPLEKLVLRTM